MKYMGSKSALLRGALGELLVEASEDATRFVDLFSGSGSVTHYVAERVGIPTLSVDLQHYSKILTESITKRTSPLEKGSILDQWASVVRDDLERDARYHSLREPLSGLDESTVKRARMVAEGSPAASFVTHHYGGHYYSLQQAYALDRLYVSLPIDEPQRSLGLAALLHAASVCAAAPGHTAQPFQPTMKLLPHIELAWHRDPIQECQRQLENLSQRHARVIGEARIGNAGDIVSELRDGDLVFCDPPYSAVQYSRFYHVIEGIARGGWPKVFGAGRAPARSFRASSDFSMKSRAAGAMIQLLDHLRERSCRVIITFPDTMASNGLSSSDIVSLASASWYVREVCVASTHSTLGGSSEDGGRGGRRALKESVMFLDPRPSTHPVQSTPTQPVLEPGAGTRSAWPTRREMCRNK